METTEVNVKCPNCTDGVRWKAEGVTVKCGTCWGRGSLAQSALDRAKMLASR